MQAMLGIAEAGVLRQEIGTVRISAAVDGQVEDDGLFLDRVQILVPFRVQPQLIGGVLDVDNVRRSVLQGLEALPAIGVMWDGQVDALAVARQDVIGAEQDQAGGLVRKQPIDDPDQRRRPHHQAEAAKAELGASLPGGARRRCGLRLAAPGGACTVLASFLWYRLFPGRRAWASAFLGHDWVSADRCDDEDTSSAYIAPGSATQAAPAQGGPVRRGLVQRDLRRPSRAAQRTGEAPDSAGATATQA